MQPVASGFVSQLPRWPGRLVRAALLVAAFAFNWASPPTPSLESIRAELAPLQGKARLAAIVDQVNRIEGRAPQEALALAAEGLELARSEGDPVREATLLSSCAYCYSQTGEFELAIQRGKESLELSRRIGNKERIAAAHNTLGIAYTFMGSHSLALEEHLESLRLREELGNRLALVRSLNNIGVLYHNIGQYENAISYYNKLLELIKDDPDDPIRILIKLNVGFSEMKLGRLRDALRKQEEALELMSKKKQFALLAYAYLNLGLTHTELEDHPKALEYLKKSLAEYGKQDQKHARVQVLNALARLHLLAEDATAAVPFALEAAALAKRISARTELMKSYDLLTKIYEKQNNMGKSHSYLKLYSEIKDQIYTIQETNKITDISTRFATLKKDNEIKILQQEKLISSLKIERSKYYSFLLFVGIVFLVAIILLLIKYNKKIKSSKLEVERANAGLEALNQELHEKIQQIRTLSGLLPICAQCKKIRNDEGYWEQLEGFISQHSAATFTHGICPTCAEDLYPEAARRMQKDAGREG